MTVLLCLIKVFVIIIWSKIVFIISISNESIMQELEQHLELDLGIFKNPDNVIITTVNHIAMNRYFRICCMSQRIVQLLVIDISIVEAQAHVFLIFWIPNQGLLKGKPLSDIYKLIINGSIYVSNHKSSLMAKYLEIHLLELTTYSSPFRH